MPQPAPTPAGLGSLVWRGPAPAARTAGAAVRLTSLLALLAQLVLLGGCAVGGGAAPVTEERRVGPAGSQRALDMAAAAPPPARFRASGVLTAWDRSRAHAFAEGDSGALRALYVPGSAAGTSDVALLRAYQARGLRVEGMRMQLLSVQVLHEGHRVLRLRVTDRLVGAVVAGEGTSVDLPRDRASTRVVELRRSPAGGWRVAWVRQ